jgi:hypothetical protein
LHVLPAFGANSPALLDHTSLPPHTHTHVPNRRDSLGLPAHVKLLPASQADAEEAQLALFEQSHGRFHAAHANKRQKIMTQSIFGAPEPAQGQQQQQMRGGRAAPPALPPPPAAAAAAGSGRSSSSSSRRGTQRPAGGSSAVGRAGSGAASAKEQLAQRVLLAKRRKQAAPFG